MWVAFSITATPYSYLFDAYEIINTLSAGTQLNNSQSTFSTGQNVPEESDESTSVASLVGARVVRIKREPAKGVKSKLSKGGLLLARHPAAGRYPGTGRTTTTLAPTTTTVTAAPGESSSQDKPAPAVDEDENASDDYEEIESTSKKAPKPKVEQPEESPDSEELEEPEQEEEETTTTTTTTTTTQRPTPAAKPKAKTGASGANKARKVAKQQQPATKQKASGEETKEPQADER